MNIVRSFRGLAILSVASLGFFAANASAESNVDVTGPTYSASARLDFRVIIPQFISFRVGTAGATVDRVEFDMSGAAAAATIGDGTDFARTNGGTVPVQLISNGGNGTVAATGSGTGLVSGANTIAWSEIDGTSDNAQLGVPAVGGSVAVAAVSGVINRSANWTFTYDNTNIPLAGTYNGTVTYTATNP